MSLRFASEHLADLRHDARLLAERADDQQGQLQAFVAAAERDMRHAEAAVSHAADEPGRRTAATGLEALIAAYEMRPGVIVMDVSMPVEELGSVGG